MRSLAAARYRKNAFSFDSWLEETIVLARFLLRHAESWRQNIGSQGQARRWRWRAAYERQPLLPILNSTHPIAACAIWLLGSC